MAAEPRKTSRESSVEKHGRYAARFLRSLDLGEAPWVSMTAAAAGLPWNAVSGRAYGGAPALMLMDGSAQARSRTWLSYGEAVRLRSPVAKGQSGTKVDYPQRAEIDGRPLWLLRSTVVFRTDQLKRPVEAAPEPLSRVPADLRDLAHSRGLKVVVGRSEFDHSHISVPREGVVGGEDAWFGHLVGNLVGWIHTRGPQRLRRKPDADAAAFAAMVQDIGAALVMVEAGRTVTCLRPDLVPAWADLVRRRPTTPYVACQVAQNCVDDALGVREAAWVANDDEEPEYDLRALLEEAA